MVVVTDRQQGACRASRIRTFSEESKSYETRPREDTVQNIGCANWTSSEFGTSVFVIRSKGMPATALPVHKEHCAKYLC